MTEFKQEILQNVLILLFVRYSCFCLYGASKLAIAPSSGSSWVLHIKPVCHHLSVLFFSLRWLSITINISKGFLSTQTVSSYITHCINLVPSCDLSVGSPISRRYLFNFHEIYESLAAQEVTKIPDSRGFFSSCVGSSSHDHNTSRCWWKYVHIKEFSAHISRFGIRSGSDFRLFLTVFWLEIGLTVVSLSAKKKYASWFQSPPAHL